VVLKLVYNLSKSEHWLDGLVYAFSYLKFQFITRKMKSHWVYCVIDRLTRCSTSRVTTLCRLSSSPSATDEYFTPSDVRARSLVTWVVVKTLPWQRRHMGRFSSRRRERHLTASCLTRSWMYWRRCLLLSSASSSVGRQRQ